MKKYLISGLIFIFGLGLFVSCSEDEPEREEFLASLLDLNGKWELASLSFEGDDYTCESQNIPANLDWMLIDFEIEMLDEIGIIYQACHETKVEYYLIKRINDLMFAAPESKDWPNPEIRYQFKVIEYEEGIVKLRVDKVPWEWDYLGCTITFIR